MRIDNPSSALETPITHENGGLEADVSAYDGLVKISGGSTSAVALPLTHENGGLEADVSAYDGIVRINGGSTSALAIPLVHEYGGLEADVSAYDGLVKISEGSTSAVTITAAGEAILDDADASAQRTTLGLGDAATYGIKDEDNMASDSDTHVPTQQSVKAYVDAAAGSGTPASTVEAETSYGISSAVGTDIEYARQDHTHGSPALLDEDNFASDDATKPPSQQSTKAYIATVAATKADTSHAHAASDITSETLVHERGGLEADVSAYDGLVKISGGSTSAVALPLVHENGGLEADVSAYDGLVKVSGGSTSAVVLPLVHENGGLEADVSAYDGLVKISGGSTSAVALPLVHENGGLEADVSAYDGLVKISGGSTSAVALPLTHENGGLEADVSAYDGVPYITGGSTSALAFKDEDNMASDSATAVCSQQSIKAYVDSQAGGGEPPDIVGGRLLRDSDAQLSWDFVTSNQITLYTGSAWSVETVTEITLDVSGLTASTVYDVYFDYNGGTYQFTTAAWSDATTPPTRTTQDGRLCKNGDAQARLVGWIYMDASQDLKDELSLRHVMNCYNPVLKPIGKENPYTEESSFTVTANAFTEWEGAGDGTWKVSFVSDGTNAVVFSVSGPYRAATDGYFHSSLQYDATTGTASHAQISAAAYYAEAHISDSRVHSAGFHYMVPVAGRPSSTSTAKTWEDTYKHQSEITGWIWC